MKKVKAVFTKQIQSFAQNPAMFGTPLFFIGLAFVLTLLIPDVTDIVAGQFAVLFVGISMIGTTGAFIAEDRATMNLRFMGMAGVKPHHYLIGTCAALLIISFVALILFGLIGRNWGEDLTIFLLVSILGAATSMLLGVTISLSKFAPLVMPISFIFGMGPIFSDANETLSSIYHFVYSQQVFNILRGDEYAANPAEAIQIILINMAVVIVAFAFMAARNGLDGERLAKEQR